ncbi:MAG: ECF-type sigma factor [Planctomycetota bacterium]
MTEARDSQTQTQTLTILLDETRDSAQRVESLLPLVYDQLRAVAQRALAAERPDHTLEATALVHEAYLKLVGEREIPWASRAHFYVAAAEAMRRVLLDHARARGRVKRGGGRARLTLSDVSDLATNPDDIVRFDEAFRRLEEESAEAAAIVRLRFFAGLSVEQAAEALGVSTSTVDRRWAFARARLHEALRGGSSS